MMKATFERYDAYKDSGVEWIGKVPEHWEVHRIKDYSYVKGRIGWQGLRNSDFVDQSDFYCVTGTDIVNGSIDWSKCYYVSEERYEQDKFIQLKQKDLLITKDGSIGKIAFVTELPLRTTLNSGLFVTRPLRYKYINEFMYWVLSSSIFRNFIDQTKGGSTIQHLYQNVFERFQYGCPSIPEQKAIAEYLSAKTKQIDRKIDLFTQKATQYGKLKQSLINETVTRGLDKRVATKDSSIDWIGEIPEHWYVQRMGDITTQNKRKNLGVIEKNLLSLSYGKIKRKNFETSFGLLPESFETYQIVNAGNIILRLTDLQNDKKSLRVGLVNERGIITSAYLGLKLSKSINPLFAYYLLFAYDISKVFYWFGGGLRQSMKYDDIKILPFIVPPIEEQKAIADYLYNKTMHIDCIIEKINVQIDKLKELRKTLIDDVVTGEIKVYKEMIT